MGYYVCDKIEFASKVDALIYSTVVNKPVEWIFHNDLFSAYPWHIEPEHSLDYYYDKRVRELREEYDYVILSYSGGSDTNNILESFIRQGLHIDEIVTNHMTKATQSFTHLDKNVKASWNFAAEHELHAVPRLKYISEKMPKTKITVLDVSDTVVGALSSFDDVDWILGKNDHLSVGQLFRYNYFHFSNIKKQFDKNLKVAIIVGLDKPKTSIVGNNLYTYFSDTVANITTISDFNADYDNVRVEMFYWSKNCLPMLCKQAHVIKRFLETNPDWQTCWYPKATINNRVLTIMELTRLVHEKLLRGIIYTTWDNDWFQTNKSTMWFNTEFDEWFRQNKDLTKQQELWKRGIKYLAQIIPEYIEYKNGEIDKMVTFRHGYSVGELNLEKK